MGSVIRWQVKDRRKTDKEHERGHRYQQISRSAVSRIVLGLLNDLSSYLKQIREFNCIFTVGPLEVSVRLLLLLLPVACAATVVPSDTAELPMLGVELFAAVPLAGAELPEVRLLELVRPLITAPPPTLSTDRLWVRSFSSRRHLARRLENHT